MDRGYRHHRCLLCGKATWRQVRQFRRPVAERTVELVLAQIGRLIPKQPEEILHDYTSNIGLVSLRQVQRALAELRKRGLVRRVGRDRLGRVRRLRLSDVSGYVRASSR
jgi:DNA-binding transcriptional ArsR family regulator